MEQAKGVIEGESLAFRATGGVAEIQDGFWQLNAGKQLWWREGKPGDVLTVEVPVRIGGIYRVEACFGFHRDYGIMELSLGNRTWTRDFYSPNLEWLVQDLGEVGLPAGVAQLRVTNRGSREGAFPGNMFGLDWIRLTPIVIDYRNP